METFMKPGIQFIENSLEWQKFLIVPIYFAGLFSMYFGYFLIKNVYKGYLAHALDKGVEWRPSSKTWAIITGATDGIGLEYAKRFAEIGYSLLLLSRNKQKLEDIKTKLLADFENCKQINVLDVDFIRDDVYERIGEEVDKLPIIDVLFNNVGMAGKSAHEYFLETSDDMHSFIPALINCNMLSMSRMIQIILPKMLEKKRGIIINNASIAGTIPVPLLTLYSASKAYMDYLSRALDIEYKDQGIVIQSLCPGVVATKLVNLDSNIKHMGIPSAKEYVDQALKTVGIESRTHGHWVHRLQVFFKETAVMLFGEELVMTITYHHQLQERAKFLSQTGHTYD